MSDAHSETECAVVTAEEYVRDPSAVLKRAEAEGPVKVLNANGAVWGIVSVPDPPTCSGCNERDQTIASLRAQLAARNARCSCSFSLSAGFRMDPACEYHKAMNP